MASDGCAVFQVPSVGTLIAVCVKSAAVSLYAGATCASGT